MDKKYIIIHVHGEGKDNEWHNLFNYKKAIKKIDTKKGYIIIPIYNSSEESEEIKGCLSNIIKENKIIGEIYICAHCDSFSLKSVKVKTYRGTNSYAYCLIDLATRKYEKESDSYNGVQKNCKKFPDFETVKKNLRFEPDPKKVILSSLSPLHLSLQAFFGISQIENREFAKVGEKEDGKDSILTEINRQRDKHVRKDGNKGLSIEFRRAFPNTDSFLLVKEAEWDFYAPLFDMVLSPTDKKKGAGVAKEFDNDNTPQEEKDMYGKFNEGKYTIAEMLKRIDETKFKDFISAFDKPIPAKWSKIQTDSKNSTVKPSLFVACLRELTTIFANTPKKDKGCFKNNCYFGYKGKYQNHCRKVLEGLNGNFRNPHCKLVKKNPDKNFGYDNTLKNQIADWCIEKSMVVIAGIEELANLLDESINNK